MNGVDFTEKHAPVPARADNEHDYACQNDGLSTQLKKNCTQKSEKASSLLRKGWRYMNLV